MNAQVTYSVFLVDDDKMFLALLKHSLLLRFGTKLKVSEYTTGEACLEHILKFHPLVQPPDIVVLDYYLQTDIHPEAADGIKVLKELKSISDDTIVIMLSGADKSQFATESFKNGAYEYIAKSKSMLICAQNTLKNATQDIRTTRENNTYLKWNRNMGILIISMIFIEVAWYFIAH